MENDKNNFSRYLTNTKKTSNFPEVIVHYLTESIGVFVNDDVHFLETQQTLPPEVIKKFNNQPALKRIFDFYIIEFWLASFSCGLYYDVNSRDKICEGIEKKIGPIFEKYENSEFIIIKDFIKNKDELLSIYRECPRDIDENTKVNFNVLLSGVSLKRFVDYHDAVIKGQAPNFFMVARRFYQHVFGVDPKSDSESASSALLTMFLAKMFSGRVVPYFDMIAELENKIDKKINKNFFLKTIKNLLR